MRVTRLFAKLAAFATVVLLAAVALPAATIDFTGTPASEVPEPSSFGLFLSGGAVLFLFTKRRRRI